VRLSAGRAIGPTIELQNVGSMTRPTPLHSVRMMEPSKITPIECDLSCSQCGYNLKGLDRGQCPECGLLFDLEELREFHAKADARMYDLYLRTIAMMLVIMVGTGVLSVVMQFIGYADQAGPRSRAWIVHNLPAPLHYIITTVAIPLVSFVGLLTILIWKYVKETKRSWKSNSWITRRVSPLLVFAVTLMMFQCGFLYGCATLGD